MVNDQNIDNLNLTSDTDKPIESLNPKKTTKNKTTLNNPPINGEKKFQNNHKTNPNQHTKKKRTLQTNNLPQIPQNIDPNLLQQNSQNISHLPQHIEEPLPFLAQPPPPPRSSLTELLLLFETGLIILLSYLAFRKSSTHTTPQSLVKSTVNSAKQDIVLSAINTAKQGIISSSKSIGNVSPQSIGKSTQILKQSTMVMRAVPPGVSNLLIFTFKILLSLFPVGLVVLIFTRRR